MWATEQENFGEALAAREKKHARLNLTLLSLRHHESERNKKLVHINNLQT
jgi:hypothetical protein